MTVSSTTNRIQYNGDASTTTFAYTWKIFADSELEVVLTSSAGVDSTQTLTTHYTVTGAGNDNGGNVEMVTAPASGETLTIKRVLALTQLTDYVTGGKFPASSHEDAIDRLVMIAQQIDEEIGRSIKLPKSSAETDLEIPDPTANYYLRWNSDADALENAELTSLGDLTAHAADANVHVSKESVTLANNTATITGTPSWIELTSESGTSDQLDKIAGLAANDEIVISAANTHTITVAKGTNLKMPGNFILNNQYDRMRFQCISTGTCVEIGRSSNS